jgi:tetratricopeptide (TPR) repeat protein
MSLNIKSLLNKAESEFYNKNYDQALKIYGLLLKDYPELKEAKVGVFLSDIGAENSEEAQSLYEYYQIIKDKDQDADAIILDLVESIEGNRARIQQLLSEPLLEQIEYEHGIKYSDFKEVVKRVGSFQRAFENIMFSTKVIIASKEEFIDFVTLLIENDFTKMALNYLDNAPKPFEKDQELLQLYERINLDS